MQTHYRAVLLVALMAITGVARAEIVYLECSLFENPDSDGWLFNVALDEANKTAEYTQKSNDRDIPTKTSRASFAPSSVTFADGNSIAMWYFQIDRTTLDFTRTVAIGDTPPKLAGIGECQLVEPPKARKF